jgi:hypothetical protein
MWLELAAANEEMRAAAHAARRLEGSMSQAQVEEAKQLVAEWKSRR